MALMMPSRQAMLPEIVGMDRMMNAVSLNMAGMNSMRLFAPALGGFIVALFGFEWGFTAMSVLYVLALISMSRVTWRPAGAPGEAGQSTISVGKSAIADIGGGLSYIWREQKLFIILAVTFVTSAFGMPIQFLLPGYVADIFAEDAGETASLAGLLLSISAIGALAGALFLATIPDKHRDSLFLLGSGTLGLGVFLFAQADGYQLAAVFMMIVGLGSAFRMALSQGLLHTYVEPLFDPRHVCGLSRPAELAISVAGSNVRAPQVRGRRYSVRLVFTAFLGQLSATRSSPDRVFVPHSRRIEFCGPTGRPPVPHQTLWQARTNGGSNTEARVGGQRCCRPRRELRRHAGHAHACGDRGFAGRDVRIRVLRGQLRGLPRSKPPGRGRSVAGPIRAHQERRILFRNDREWPVGNQHACLVPARSQRSRHRLPRRLPEDGAVATGKPPGLLHRDVGGVVPAGRQLLVMLRWRLVWRSRSA